MKTALILAAGVTSVALVVSGWALYANGSRRLGAAAAVLGGALLLVVARALLLRAIASIATW